MLEPRRAVLWLVPCPTRWSQEHHWELLCFNPCLITHQHSFTKVSDQHENSVCYFSYWTRHCTSQCWTCLYTWVHLTGTEEILKLPPSPASGHSSEAVHVCLGGSSISLGPCFNTFLPLQGKLVHLHPAGTSRGLIYDHYLPFSRHGAQGEVWVQLLSNFLDGSGELLVGLPKTFFFLPGWRDPVHSAPTQTSSLLTSLVASAGLTPVYQYLPCGSPTMDTWFPSNGNNHISPSPSYPTSSTAQDF